MSGEITRAVENGVRPRREALRGSAGAYEAAAGRPYEAVRQREYLRDLTLFAAAQYDALLELARAADRMLDVLAATHQRVEPIEPGGDSGIET